MRGGASLRPSVRDPPPLFLYSPILPLGVGIARGGRTYKRIKRRQRWSSRPENNTTSNDLDRDFESRKSKVVSGLPIALLARSLLSMILLWIRSSARQERKDRPLTPPCAARTATTATVRIADWRCWRSLQQAPLTESLTPPELYRRHPIPVRGNDVRNGKGL